MEFPEQPDPNFSPQSIEGILEYYNKYFVPIFAYSTAVSGILSEQMLNELRNCIDHLAKANRQLDVEGNLQKAKNHIDRSCLDCAKIAWVELYDYADELYKSHQPKDYILVDNGHFWEDISNIYTNLREASHRARKNEPESINDDVGNAIGFYYKANALAEELAEKINIKTADIHHQVSLYNKRVNKRDATVAIVSAVISAIISVPLGMYLKSLLS